MSIASLLAPFAIPANAAPCFIVVIDTFCDGPIMSSWMDTDPDSDDNDHISTFATSPEAEQAVADELKIAEAAVARGDLSDVTQERVVAAFRTPDGTLYIPDLEGDAGGESAIWDMSTLRAQRGMDAV